MQPRLIIFDFDGTLADTTAPILWTYRQTSRTLGLLSAESRISAQTASHTNR